MPLTLGRREVELEPHLSTVLSPGEIRALQFVTERHPAEVVSIWHVRDHADCGWIVARVHDPVRGSRWRRNVRDYWCSPTGRVFAGEPSWLNPHFSSRTDEELREADYATC